LKNDGDLPPCAVQLSVKISVELPDFTVVFEVIFSETVV